MKKNFIWLVACIIAIAICIPLSFANANEGNNDVEGKKVIAFGLIAKTISAIQHEGIDKVVTDINNKSAAYSDGSIYVFIYNVTTKDNSNCILIANPNVKKEELNLDYFNVPDSKGTEFRKEIVQKSVKRLKGIQEYVYKNPDNGKEEEKVTCFQRHENYIICCGIYK